MLSWRLQSVLVRGVTTFFVASILMHLPTGVFAESRNLFSVRDDEYEVVQMRGAPPGITWIVQISDVHISKWVPARGRALRKSLGSALKLIKPSAVLVTGDLTDAKNKDRTVTLQQEMEWIEYRESFLKVADDSGIPLEYFHDLRGNHDKYGVPLSSPLDYYSKYSISAAVNRSSLVQSVLVQGRDGRKHLLVGFDDTMHIGLRGPSNIFGHPTDDLFVKLDQELSRYDNIGSNPITKIVYGHFPMSFTTSTETKRRLEDVMAKNDVSAYVCGHLHTVFGHRLYKHHKYQGGDFWEWEMGDWRASRMMRIVAIDHGHTSFVDVELISPEDKSDGEFTMETIILQTYPLDSRFMLQASTKGAENSDVVLNSIRALVFSETTPMSVHARIYDFSSNPPLLVNESVMTIIEEDHDKIDGGAHYYVTLWDRERYIQNGGLRYAVQIVSESKNGILSRSEMRLVSATGDPGEFHLTMLAFLVMGFKWEVAFPALVWSMILLLITLLVVTKVFFFQLEKDGQYEEWMFSVFRPSSSPSGALGKVIKVPFWVFLECSRNNFVWLGSMVYVSYLTFFPWFSGRVLADDHPVGHMSLRGWTVEQSKADFVGSISGLGTPDIMATVIPYVFGVLLPLLLMVAALSAERAACEFHMRNLGECQKTKKYPNAKEFKVERIRVNEAAQEHSASSSEVVQGSIPEDCKLESTAETDFLILNSKDSSGHQCNLCTRKVRKGLFVGCLAVTFIHWRLCLVIFRAFGMTALATGHAYMWGVPILLILTIIQTATVRCKSLSRKYNMK